MKLKELLIAAVALFSISASAQVVVNEMTSENPADYFKNYEGVSAELVTEAAYTVDKTGLHYYANLDQTNNSAYVAIKAQKTIKEVRVLVTGNGSKKKVCPGLIGLKDSVESFNFLTADYATSADPVNIATSTFADAEWITFNLEGQGLKEVYIAKQWKNVVVGENAKASFPASNAQSFFAWGFQIALEGDSLPDIVLPEVDPQITKVEVLGISANIDQNAKTISIELPYGTHEAEALANLVIEDNKDDLEPVLDLEKGTLTIGEVVYSLVITIAEDPNAPSDNVVLTEIVFSNGVKGAIKNGEEKTVSVPYIGQKPTFVSGKNEDEKATVSVDGDKVLVVNGELKAEYALSFQEYSLAPLAVDSPQYAFNGEEIGVWVNAPYGYDNSKGVKMAKDVEEESNRRISEGRTRIYLFVPAADSVKLTTAISSKRNLKVSINGVADDNTYQLSSSTPSIVIPTGNVPALIGLESTNNSGDAGISFIQLLSQDTTQIVPVDTTQIDTTIVEPIEEGTHEIIADWANGIGTFEAVGKCSVESKDGSMKFESGYQKGQNYYVVEPAQYPNFSTGDTIVFSQRINSNSNCFLEIYNADAELIYQTEKGSTEYVDYQYVLTAPTKQLRLGRNGGTTLYLSQFKVYAIAERDTIATAPVDTTQNDTTVVEPVDPSNHEIIADWQNKVGTFELFGTCTTNSKDNALQFKNSFNSGDNYVSVSPDKYNEFVKGDTIVISQYITSSGKVARIEIFNSENQSLFLTDTATTETETFEFVLEASTEELRLARSGATSIFVPEFKIYATPQRTKTSIDMNEMNATLNIQQSTLTVNCEAQSSIQVYSIDGRMIDNQSTTNYSRTLATGAYIVRINGKSVKAIIK